MNVVAVIPAHNEQEHIANVVRDVKRYISNVLVIDDASDDGTRIEAQGSGAQTLRHRLNLGKAGAIKTGCEVAISQGADVIILIDGDGQHDPVHINEFLNVLKDTDVDIVFGSRTDLTDMPMVRFLGTKLLEHSMRFLFHINLHDMQCGYRAFRTRVYPQISWSSGNYHADAEITARAGKCGLVYREIPIRTIYHDTLKGMTIIDGITLLSKLIFWKYTL